MGISIHRPSNKNKMATSKQERIQSIDALRGFDMLLIIFMDKFFIDLDKGVNSNFTHSLAKQFDHPEWLGSTFYDIVMPLFLFLVGAVIPFSLSNRKTQSESLKPVYVKLIKRFIILFVLGWVVQGNLLSLNINNFVFFSNTLQAIAVGYLVSSIAYLHLNIKGQIIAFGSFLLIYILILTTLNVPGIGAGILEPNKNFALYFDHLVFGNYHDGKQYTWLLSGFGFAATTMSGMFAGQLIKSKLPRAKITRYLVIIGIVSLLLGLILNIWHPIIKKLWTSSFVLTSTGVCFLLIALFYWIIDVKNKVNWTFPLRIIGMNAITAYVLSHIFNFSGIVAYVLYGLEPIVGNYYQLILSISGFLMLYLLLWYMYKNKTFIRI